MDLVEPFIRNAVFPLWLMKNRSQRGTFAKQLEESQYRSCGETRALQFDGLRRLVQHAYSHCEFYRSKYDAAGFDPRTLVEWTDVQRIPCITKQDIQNSLDSMISDNTVREELLRDMTGGSTGAPMVFFYDPVCRDQREAAAIRHDRWSTWDIGRRKAVIWGAPRDTHVSGNLGSRFREALIERRLILDAAQLTDERMKEFARLLLDYRPAVIQAYANTLVYFASFLRLRGIRGVRASGIITSAEVLTEEGRRLIESTFECRVYNRYGCREFGVIASECGHDSGMHVNAENLLVEVPWPDSDGIGEIVISDLRNYAMPMIRYRIQDMGRMLADGCGCGRGLPRMEIVGGRVSDFLVGTDGRRVSGIVIATYAITNIRGVQQVQFIQHQRDEVTVGVVKGPQWDDDAGIELIKRTREFLGDGMQVTLQFKDRIDRDPSGKYRFSISAIHQ